MPKHLFTTLLFILSISVQGQIKTGADNIIARQADILKGKRVGAIVNQTSLISDGTHLIDALVGCGVDITVIFAPEHGFRGTADAGEHISDGIDPVSKLPVISLYGKNKKPSDEQLSNVDVLLFDIQDVGARFYTYTSTMYYAMQAAAENGKQFVVLDRPNPNDYVDGPVIVPSLYSFVGTMPLPVMHGLTVGELARMIKGENWGNTASLNLTVVPCSGWKHGEPYSLKVKPSPNLPDDQSISLYPSLCLFEGTIISVGRGTTYPFKVIGAPISTLGNFTFTPEALPGFDKNPMYKGKTCYGEDLRKAESPKGFSLEYLFRMYKLSRKGAAFFTSPSFFDRLAGDPTLRQDIISGKSIEEIRSGWSEDLARYKAVRSKYLLYEEPLQ
ncbi:MAG: DUF1343 domain-containing protein [Bacteroidetes bacterium]|uniref:DUF1343 domain-containing protein n=1 Tax=Candidatus Caccoplasma merdipullorum TaxID=2840718 RepID=A0A9D9H5V1_9BACT|nr:DUF1343 domain-containing protein [Candidatus Caccoplasma merdipullorum]